MIDLDGICYPVETYWCDKPHTHFVPSIQYSRGKPILTWFLEKGKIFNIGFYSNIYRPISFKLNIMIETTKFYILMQRTLVWWSYKVTVVWQIKSLCVHFLGNIAVDLDEIQCCHGMLVCWSFTQNYLYKYKIVFCASDSQGRELCCDFMLNIVLCQHTCQSICFKLGMMLNTMKWTVIPDWMTLNFTQGHGITGRQELVQSFCCKVTQSNSNVHDGWLCREMSEKVLHGEYRWY